MNGCLGCVYPWTWKGRIHFILPWIWWKKGLMGRCAFRVGRSNNALWGGWFFSDDDLDDILPGLLENKAKVFYPMGRDSELDHSLLEWINHIRSQSRNGVVAPGELVCLDLILHEMRLFKSAGELKLMRRAAEVSANAHVKAMQACKQGCMNIR